MYFHGETDVELFRNHSCNNLNCMVNNDFPRYICGLDKQDGLCWEEYALGSFYVKVSSEGSRIYRLNSCILLKEVKLPEPLWLNTANLRYSLDRLAALHYLMDA